MKKLFSLLTFSILMPLLVFGQFKDREKAELGTINLLVNPGFELGLLRWGSSGTAPTLTTTSSEVAYGKAAASWDAASDGDTFSSQQYDVPEILKGNICEASLWYKGGDENIDLRVVDGSSNLLGKVTLSAAATWTKASVTITCPTSGSVGFTLYATADAAEIFVDQAVLGRSADLVDVISTSQWTDYRSSAVLSAGSGGSVSGATFSEYKYVVVGNMVFASVRVTFTISSTPATVNISLPIAAASNVSGASLNHQNVGLAVDGDNSSEPNAYWETTSGGSTINAFKDRSATAWSAGSSGRLMGSFWYQIDPGNVPSSVNPVRKVGTSAWHVSASLSGTIDLGNSSDAGHMIVANSGIEVASGSNSLTAYALCDGAVSSAATCSGVDELLGIAFNAPRAGNVLVCTSLRNVVLESSGTADLRQDFRIDRVAADGSITDGQEGATYSAIESSSLFIRRIELDNSFATTGPGHHDETNLSQCGIFYVNAGLNGFAISERTVAAGGSVETNTASSVNFQIFPIDQQLPQALMVMGADARIWLTTANGHGSSATKIRTFADITKDQGGEDLSVNQSATNGDSITINSGGIYSVVAGDRLSSGATCDFGISLNASSLTTSIESLDVDEWLCYVGNNATAMNGSCSYTGRFQAGDVIRLHTTGDCNGTVHTYLKIEKIAN